MTIPETSPAWSQVVHIPQDRDAMPGHLVVPANARGVVLFAQGGGSGRHSSRNRMMSSDLNESRLATLLLDLMTPAEERTDDGDHPLRSDLGQLAARLVTATDWLAREPSTARLPLGYLATSTGAGAALVAAIQRPERVRAVVSRGGRPDLAADALPHVQAPTLLIVGEQDPEALEFNRQALRQMTAESRLAIVPAATHLFEEPGALRVVARLASDWFVRRMAQGR